MIFQKYDKIEYYINMKQEIETYFAIVNLKEAHINSQIKICVLPVVKIGKHILGWEQKVKNLF